MISRNLRFTILHRFCFPEANAKVATPENGNQSNVLTLSKQKLLKKSMLLLVAFFIFTSVNLMAQSPQKINFQSIVRNTNGVIFSNKTLSFKISILSGSITGTQVYSETHSSTTDAIGLVSLQIGSGTALSGSFATINWGNTAHFIKLEADFNGGNTYVTLGTQELMSVPYAMYASKTDTTSLNLTNRFADKASVNNPTFTGTVGGITKAMVGLSDVDNTTDLNKPVSTLTQTALALKAPLANPTFTGTVYGIDKGMVGLGSVDNTTDASKPVSTATQTALNTKAPINNPEFTGQVYGIDKGMVGLGNVDNTSDVSKPVSAATQTALALKAPLANPTFTGTVGGITKAMVGLSDVDNTTDVNKPVSAATQTALDMKFNISDFPRDRSANEILYWNGLNWVSLPPGTTGQVLTMSSDGLSWGCIITSTVGTSPSPTLAVNTPMTDITIETTGVTGIVDALLPEGLEATWLANVIKISGKPTVVGTSQYSIYLRVSCGNPLFVEGEITVSATAPGAPTDVVAKAGDESASIAFVAPMNDGGRQITGYTVTSNANNITASGPTSPIKVLGLSNGTAYTFTVVATNAVNNSVASAISNEVTPAPVCPTPTITYNDYDYKTVGIGDQCWMAENLRTRKYRDGTAIPFDASGGPSGNVSPQTWSALTSGAHTLYAHDSTTSSSNLWYSGYLYNWYAVNDSRQLCPEGWNVPTDAEWSILTNTLEGVNVAGGKMKSTGTNYWSSESVGTNNSSGFSALPGGYRRSGGSFDDIRNFVFFWSSTLSKYSEDYALIYYLTNGADNLSGPVDYSKKHGANVRCLRD